MIQTVSSEAFTYDKDARQFIAEVSSLGKAFRFGRIYPDACDEGFQMASSSTGRIATWVIQNVIRSEEEEISLWQLIPTPQTVRLIPTLKGATVILFND